MSRFIDEADRSQGTLLPESIDEYVSEENPVRVIEAFVDSLDLAVLGFAGVEPEATGRPAYHPAAIKNVCREFIVLCRRWQTQPSEFSGRATRNRYSQQERYATPSGQTGYIALYRFVVPKDEVRMLVIRHQREIGFVP